MKIAVLMMAMCQSAVIGYAGDGKVSDIEYKVEVSRVKVFAPRNAIRITFVTPIPYDHSGEMKVLDLIRGVNDVRFAELITNDEERIAGVRILAKTSFKEGRVDKILSFFKKIFKVKFFRR